MGPYNNKNGKPTTNRLFGQTMKKSNKSSSASRYQRQFGNGYQRQQPNGAHSSSKADTAQLDEVAERRRQRREQGEIIDTKFGYHRLEDQYLDRQQNSRLRTGDAGGVDKLMQRRGWLFNMAATTVRLSPKTDI